MTTPNPRDQLVGGLRQLADYLDTHPAIPVASHGWDLLIPTHCDSDPEGIAEVDRIAAILGVTPEDGLADRGHYSAIKTFGPITYQAFHIPASYRAAHRAFMTYAESVTPDGDPGDPPQAA
jgi:hypothetical protein